MVKRIVRVFVLVVVISAVVLGVRWYKKKESGANGSGLKIYGTIDIRDASLSFNEPERISEVLVEEGNRVEAGQVLARQKTDRIEAQIAELQAQIEAQTQVVNRLKSGSRPQEIEQARAEVAAARARVRNAQQTFQRIEKTSGTGATSEQSLDDARSHLDVERAQLEVRQKALNLALEGPRREDITAAEKNLGALNASLSLLNIRLGDMTLTAPAPGIIQSRILEPGEMAGPTQPVVTLALTDPKWVRAYVSEPDLGRISSGKSVKVYCDSFPGEAIDGWIGFISPTAEFTPKTVQTEELRTKLVYEVRVFVHDTGNRLRLGMPVTVAVNGGV
jgi:HlyD family secretion protein